MSEQPTKEKAVVIHQAGTSTEAMVIRGLLESAGIASPPVAVHDSFPMREPPKGMPGVEIVVLESQAEDALRIISEFLNSTENIQLEDGEPET